MNTFLLVVAIYLSGYIFSYMSFKLFHTKICKEEWTYGDRIIGLAFSFFSYIGMFIILVGLACIAHEIIEEKYKISELLDVNNRKKAKW